MAAETMIERPIPTNIGAPSGGTSTQQHCGQILNFLHHFRSEQFGTHVTDLQNCESLVWFLNLSETNYGCDVAHS